jgi:putative sporulation protein YyaC
MRIDPTFEIPADGPLEPQRLHAMLNYLNDFKYRRDDLKDAGALQYMNGHSKDAGALQYMNGHSKEADVFHWTGEVPVVLCIGTDRIIGDCLGPLTGTMLEKATGGRMPVYGTLHRTVHALNLCEKAAEIKKKHPGRLILAVDASLGSYNQIGEVLVRQGQICPGSGVSKDLPPVGDVSITGIVGCESSQPYLDLQTARLSTVSAMAEQICRCILNVCAAEISTVPDL